MQLRRLVPTLLDHERMEVPWEIGTETRLYTERLIQEAIRASCEQDTLSVLKVWLESEQTEMRDAQAGLCGSPILEMVVFWLTKPSLVEKLFKVFVPRYRFYSRPYTSIFRIQGPNYPSPHPNRTHAILELHGNPWPPVLGHLRACRGPGGAEPFKNHYLINVLVASARNSARLLQQSSTPSSPDVVKSSV
ncbi:unnamed protein product [Calicophoron daubneyi]|uniref:Large ribosomal subunit protein bL17m n=1 Tax=Calicophoron daubneyi TaxID=300641 RepID=A0AAV2U047_CALDB